MRRSLIELFREAEREKERVERKKKKKSDTPTKLAPNFDLHKLL